MLARKSRQPWAWAIMHAGKDIENRSWKTRLRGQVAIHAAKGLTRKEFDEGVRFIRRCSEQKIPSCEALVRGAIIGTVEIADCVDTSKSKLFFGKYGFVLKNPRPIDAIYCGGTLGFWVVPLEIERKIGGDGPFRCLT